MRAVDVANWRLAPVDAAYSGHGASGADATVELLARASGSRFWLSLRRLSICGACVRSCDGDRHSAAPLLALPTASVCADTRGPPSITAEAHRKAGRRRWEAEAADELP